MEIRLCSVCNEWAEFEGSICAECLEEERAFLEAEERERKEREGLEEIQTPVSDFYGENKGMIPARQKNGRVRV